MSYSDILVEDRGPASWITLNRPDVLNALRPKTYEELLAALAHAEANEKTQFIVLTGAGRAFCAGDDFNEIFLADEALVGEESDGALDRYKSEHGAATPIVTAMQSCTKPLIAVINGVAVGVGLDIALLCDVRICAEEAKLGAFFVKRGFCGTVGGTVLLPRIIGLSRAMEFLLSGETIDGKTAAQMGMVSRALPAEELSEEADTLIDKLSLGAPLAQRAIKRIVMKGLGVDLTAMEEYTRLLSDPLWSTDDHKEGIQSHLERRRPDFKGR